MAYPLDETFATGIPPGFGANGGGSPFTVSWNATAQAVDLTFPNTVYAFWQIAAAEQSTDFWFEMDIEIVAASGNPALGFRLWGGVGSYDGHELSIRNGHWTHWQWSLGGGQTEETNAVNAAWAVVGARRTLRLDMQRSAQGGVWRCQLMVDGVVVWHDTRRQHATLLPGICGTQTTLRLHRVAGGTPSSLGEAPAWTQRGLPLALASRTLVPEHAAALDFTHRGLRLLAGTRNHYYHGRHRITGTVKEKASPNDLPVSRRVLLFDERASCVVRETWSDALTGAYSFEYLNPEVRYLVLAFDHRQLFRATAADKLSAEPMP